MPGMKATFSAAAVLMAACLASVIARPVPVQSQASAPAALAGTVASKAEGNMEGVVIIAQREGSPVMVAVTSDARGRYSFPRTHLQPGPHTITVRAIGYDLAAPATATLDATRPASLNLTLVQLTDKNRIASQLTSAEWLQSMPGPQETKDRFWRRAANCGFCHNMEKVMRTRYTAQQWVPVIKRMASYDADHTTGHGKGLVQMLVAGRPGFDGYGNPDDTWWEYPMTDMAAYLETVNLSGGKSTWSFDFKTLPRPKGRGTRAIVTVFPIPRQPSVIHDVNIDSKGNAWYGNSAWNYIGKLDPKTGEFSEWPLPPVTKLGRGVRGILDHALDPDDNLWASWQGKLAKFDSKTEMWTQYDLPPGSSCGGFWASPRKGLDTMWTGGSERPTGGITGSGACRFNYKTGKVEIFPLYNNAPPGQHRGYQTERDSKDNAYQADWGALWETPGLSHYIVKVDSKTRETKWFPTPTPKSFPRRGAMDNQDRFWFAEFWADKI